MESESRAISSLIEMLKTSNFGVLGHNNMTYIHDLSFMHVQKDQLNYIQKMDIAGEL